jgi:hypothetical protein
MKTVIDDMTDMDLRKLDDKVRAAYFAYRKKFGTKTTSVVSFVAGWNASKKAGMRL